jgi:hypothetical protein
MALAAIPRTLEPVAADPLSMPIQVMLLRGSIQKIVPNAPALVEVSGVV